MSEIIFPMVHMNGTHPRDLQEQYLEFKRSLAEAREKLPHPNGRDYYPKGPDEIGKAVEQARGWDQKLKEMEDVVEKILLEITKQGKL